MGADPKEVSVRQEVFRWGGVIALLYAAVLLVICPCDSLLKCKDHMGKFTLALALSLGLVSSDRFLVEIKPKIPP